MQQVAAACYVGRNSNVSPNMNEITDADAIKNTAGLSKDQCKLENYVSGDGFLRFPAVATDNELLHSIKDVTCNGADGLMDFALPSATNAMPKRLFVCLIVS